MATVLILTDCWESDDLRRAFLGLIEGQDEILLEKMRILVQK